MPQRLRPGREAGGLKHLPPLPPLAVLRSDGRREQLGQRSLHGGGGACGFGPGRREEGVRALRLSAGEQHFFPLLFITRRPNDKRRVGQTTSISVVPPAGVPADSLPGRGHRLGSGNPADQQDAGGVPGPDHEHLQRHALAQGTTLLSRFCSLRPVSEAL